MRAAWKEGCGCKWEKEILWSSSLAVGVNYTSHPNTSCISLSNKTPSLHLLQVWVYKCVCTRFVVRIWAPSYGEASAAAWLRGLRAALYSCSHKGFLPFLALKCSLKLCESRVSSRGFEQKVTSVTGLIPVSLDTVSQASENLKVISGAFFFASCCLVSSRNPASAFQVSS